MGVCRCIPGHYFSPEDIWALVPVYAIQGKVVEGGANVLLGQAAGKGGNVSPSTALEGRYVSGPPVDGFMQVNKPSAEPATAVEGDVHAGASTVTHGRAGGTVARACLFAVAETASGLARLPDLLPVAYGLLYLWCLPLTVLMHCSVVFPPTGPGFCLGAFQTPMCSAVSGQVF